MPAPLYTVPSGASLTLTGTTVKTLLGVKAHANSGLLLKKLKMGFDGITASAAPALVELCYCTWATNSPGTNSTSITIVQSSGRVLTAGLTGGRNWTAEPTVITPIEDFLFPQFMGMGMYDIPLGDEYDCALGEGFCLRITPTATVNVRASLVVSRC